MPGSGFGPVARDEPHVVHVPEPDGALAERELLWRVAGVGRRAARRPADAPSRSCRRRRSGCAARSRARPRGRRSSSSIASIHCTLRPGRIVRTRSSSGASGTGRINSTVTRATNAAGPGSCCSHTVANNALGAPPCNAFGLHGPRASWRRHVARAVAFEERAVRRDRIVSHAPNRTRPNPRQLLAGNGRQRRFRANCWCRNSVSARVGGGGGTRASPATSRAGVPVGSSDRSSR